MCYSGSSGAGAWIHCIIASSRLLFYISKTYHQDPSNTPGFQFYKLLQTFGHVSNGYLKEKNEDREKCSSKRVL